MSTYIELRGLKVKYVPTDTTSPSTAAAGDVWYNTTSGVLKGFVGRAAWSAGAPGVQARRSIGGFGTQTAAVAVGGIGPNPTVFNDTEEYNGSAWALGGDYPTAASGVAGCGTLTAGLTWGGTIPPPALTNASNTYNGTAWTSGPNLNTARAHTSNNIGTQTAALAAGGGEPLKGETEEYDGSSWTESGDLSTDRQGVAAGGIQTASWIAGGEGPASPAETNATEEYNGSSWTAGGDLNEARYFISGSGPLTSGIAFGGGEPANSNKTEIYDGSSWTAFPTLGTAKQAGMGAGASSTAALAGFGATGPTALLSGTEEFNNTFEVVTAGAWASSPALSFNVDGNLAAAGTATASVANGGYNSPAGPGTSSYIAEAASWDGSAWTNITDIPERRTNHEGSGTATANIFYGGINQPPSPGTAASYRTEGFTWDGSSWTTLPDMAEGQSNGGGAGTSTATIYMGGVNPPGDNSDNIALWDGSAWANSPVDMPANMSALGSCGTQTAAIAFGGYQGGTFPTGGVDDTYEWDGSAISSGGDLLVGMLNNCGTGTSTAALSISGRIAPDGSKTTATYRYDGTAWATAPHTANSRDSAAKGPSGTQTAALAISGSSPGGQKLVEEFTGESSAETASTIDFD